MARQQRQAITAFVYDRRGRLLSTGNNSYIKTHVIQAKAADAVGRPSCIYLHAEIAALVKLKDWTKAHKMVILRYAKADLSAKDGRQYQGGTPVLAKPCSICQHVINQTNIQLIEYTK